MALKEIGDAMYLYDRYTWRIFTETAISEIEGSKMCIYIFQNSFTDGLSQASSGESRQVGCNWKSWQTGIQSLPKG